MGTTAMSSAVSRLVPPAVNTIRREGSPARNDTARKTPAMPQNVPLGRPPGNCKGDA